MNGIKLPTKDQKYIKQNTFKNHFISLKIIIIDKFSLSVGLAHHKNAVFNFLKFILN